MLFIDANIYLGLFENRQDDGILDQLAKLSSRIFATKQVAEEVQRNRAEVVAKTLKNFPKVEVKNLNSWPGHLFSLEMFSELGATLNTSSGELNQRLAKSKHDLQQQIDQREDPVSKTLAVIFRNQITHSPAELERARERFDRGNPPGKGTKLGDQLNWEQLVGRFRDKVWIISNDKDYGTLKDGRWILDELLYDELRSINPKAEAHLFGDLGKGIQDFLKKNGET